MRTFAIPDEVQTAVPETGPAGADVPPADKPLRRPLWRRAWFQWVVGVGFTVLLVTSLVLLLLSQSSTGSKHDPRNMGPEGSAALVALIRQDGVRVTTHLDRHVPGVGPDTTVVLTAGNNLQRAQFDQLLRVAPTRIILAGFSAGDLSRLGLPLRGYFGNSTGLLEPGCEFAPARKAGTIENPGTLYALTGATSTPVKQHSCYAADAAAGGHAYLQFNVAGVEVAVVSGGFSNRSLSGRGSALPKGNAAFMMMLFGQDRTLVWWVVPQPEREGGAQETTPPGVLPDGIVWFLVALLALLVVVAVWRGRRLGPILTERLPVVIRAAETVEGHGRMYHRLRAYDQAAQHLRAGALTRLGRRFGTNDPARLADIIAENAGIPSATAHAALTGPPPGTEIDLIELKQLLHRIEQEARS